MGYILTTICIYATVNTLKSLFLLSVVAALQQVRVLSAVNLTQNNSIYYIIILL